MMTPVMVIRLGGGLTTTSLHPAADFLGQQLVASARWHKQRRVCPFKCRPKLACNPFHTSAPPSKFKTFNQLCPKG
eukprot:2695465-Amphidinium_carterae.1